MLILPKHKGVPMNPGLHAHVVKPRVELEQVALLPQSASLLHALISALNKY
jgi:hypothetical protein